MTAPDDDRFVRLTRLIAHGMRNPLAVATGMLDLLDRQVGEQLDDDVRDLLRRSSVAVRRAGDQLLDLQRYTGAARDVLVVDDVDLAEAVGVALDGLDLAGATVELVPDPPVLRADPRAVSRALRELVANAVRHGGDGRPPTICISARDAGDAWEVVVDDDGPGIPAGQRADAMVEGERLGRTGDGFGLGLPVVRVLLARHGGTVALHDAPGGGLRVVLRWPTDPLLGEQGPQG